MQGRLGPAAKLLMVGRLSVETISKHSVKPEFEYPKTAPKGGNSAFE